MTHCLHQRDKIDNDCNRTSATVRFQMMPSPMITRSKDTISEVAFTRPPRNQRQKCYHKEEIDFIEDLKKRNEALHCEQRRLQGKLKIASITIQKLKEQVQTWKRRCTTNMNHLGNTSSTNYYCTRSRNATAKQNGCKIRVNSICATNTSNGSNDNCTGYLEDNHHQQRQNPDEVRCSSVDCYKERAPGKEAEMINFLREQAGKNAGFDNCSRDGGSSRDIIINDDPQISALLHKLKKAKSDMNTLQVQYIALESASEVQLELHQQTLEQLEECNLYILELKDSICRLNESHDKLKNMSISMDEHKEIMQELLQENKYLEDKLSTLCELPFLSVGEQDIRALANCSPHAIEIRQHQEQMEQRNHELENEIDQCKQQIELLSKTNFDLHEHTLLLEKENNELKSSLALSQGAVLAKGKNVNTTSHQQGHNTDSLDENL